jgi:hypothetical protein
MKSGNINFLEHSGPLQACNGDCFTIFSTALLKRDNVENNWRKVHMHTLSNEKDVTSEYLSFFQQSKNFESQVTYREIQDTLNYEWLTDGIYLNNLHRDCSVGIATSYGLDGTRTETRWGRDFPHLSRPALGLTQPPAQWVTSRLLVGEVAGAWRWPITDI